MTKKGHRKFPGPAYWKVPGPVQKPSPPLLTSATYEIELTHFARYINNYISDN